MIFFFFFLFFCFSLLLFSSKRTDFYYLFILCLQILMSAPWEQTLATRLSPPVKTPQGAITASVCLVLLGPAVVVWFFLFLSPLFVRLSLKCMHNLCCSSKLLCEFDVEQLQLECGMHFCFPGIHLCLQCWILWQRSQLHW